MNRRSRFCDYCGHKLSEDSEWPKFCEGHGGHVWANPTPIGVAVIPVFDPRDPDRFGILVGQRNHEPAKGLFGLPGGFQNDIPQGETIMEGAVREVVEEMGVILRVDLMRYHYEFANPNQSQTLVFFSYGAPLELGRDVSIGPCTVSPECSFIDVIWNPCELAFQSHTEAARLWFQQARLFGRHGETDES